jgi:hypothetical protein
MRRSSPFVPPAQRTAGNILHAKEDQRLVADPAIEALGGESPPPLPGARGTWENRHTPFALGAQPDVIS